MFTKPLHEATSFNSNALIEFPQLLELTQKLCVLEDFSFTNPANTIVTLACLGDTAAVAVAVVVQGGYHQT